MLNMKIRNNTIHIGDHFSVQFERTLRIPPTTRPVVLPQAECHQGYYQL